MNDYDEFKRFYMADEQTEEQIDRAHKLEEKVDKLQKELAKLREENRVLKEQLKPYLDQIESKKVKRIVLKRVD